MPVRVIGNQMYPDALTPSPPSDMPEILADTENKPETPIAIMNIINWKKLVPETVEDIPEFLRTLERLPALLSWLRAETPTTITSSVVKSDMAIAESTPIANESPMACIDVVLVSCFANAATGEGVGIATGCVGGCETGCVLN